MASTALRTPLVALAALGLFACSGGERQVIDKPIVVLFSASPIDVAPGGTTMLRWEVMAADNVRIDSSDGTNVLPESSQAKGSIVSPALQANTTFTLTALSAGGTTTQTVEVTVGGAGGPQVVAFAANPTTLAAPGMVALNWQTTGGTSLQITAGGAAVYTADAAMVAQGTTMVQVDTTTTYTLVVTDAMSRTAQSTVTVTIGAAGPTITDFSANPTTVTAGMPATLSWTVANAASISIRDGAGAVVHMSTDASGTFVVMPQATTTYTLVALDANNAAASAMTTVTVNGAPGPAVINSFTAMPNPVPEGMMTTLSWNVTNAPEGIDIIESGNVVASSMMPTGTFAVTPAATRDYQLVAKNAAGGNAMQTLTVTVIPANQTAVTSFTATPNPIATGASTTLAWTTVNADRVRVLDGNTAIVDTMTDVATGNVMVMPMADTTYTVEATLMGGTPVTQTVDVYVHAAPIVTTFTVTPQNLMAAGMVTVTWDVQNVSSLTLTAGGMAVPGFTPVTTSTGTVNSAGTLQVQVTQNTTFQLNAASLAGMLSPAVDVTIGGPNTEVEPNDTIDAATPFNNGGTIGGALAANDIDLFAVTVPAGGSIRAETSDGMGGCATDTLLALLGPGGLVLTQDDNSGTTPCSLIDPAVAPIAADLVAGTYYVGVAGANAAVVGAYTLDVTVSPAQCGNSITELNATEQCDDGNTTANDGCSATCQIEVNPTVITAPGGTVSLTFNANTSLHVVQIDVPTNGQAIAIAATDPGGTTCNNVNTAINLADANLRVLGSKADGGPTGTAGDCAAILYPTDAFAADLAAGTYYAAILAESGTGTVQITVNVNNPVCGNGLFETRTEQCDDNNTANNDGCSAMCTLELTQTVSLPAASPIVVASSIATAGEFDAFQVTVTQETQLRVETFAPTVASGGCANTDTFLLVYDQSLNLIGFDDEGGNGSCSRLDENAPGMRLAPGTYFVEVFEFFGGTIPAYEIRFESVPIAPNTVFDSEPNDTQAAAQASGLTGAGSATVQGIISPDGDDDVFSFTVPANQTYTLTARTHDVRTDPTACTAQSPVTDTRIFVEQAGLEVVTPNSVEVANNDDANAAGNIWCSAVTNVPIAGGTSGATYYVRVQGFGDTGFRAYFLTMTLQ